MISVMTSRQAWSRKVMLAVGIALVLGLPVEADAHHDEVVDKLKRGVTERVSVSSSGEQGDGDSGFAGTCGSKGWAYSASDDGRYVVFASKAGNLHPADANGRVIQDIFVHDREKGKTDLVSAMPSGLAPESPVPIDVDANLCDNRPADGIPVVRSHTPAISGNGRYVAFVSNLPLTGTDDPAAATLDQVFVRNLKKGTTELVSRTWDGLPPIGNPLYGSGWSGLSISDGGRFVAFTSGMTNIMEDVCPIEIVPGLQVPVLPDCRQTYVRDRKRDETILVSRSSTGEPADFSSEDPSISGNGRYVVFGSEASNLVTGDLNVCPASVQLGPSCADVFVHDLSTQKTELVSVSRDGASGNENSEVDAWTSGFQAVSNDGRYVAFRSAATNLVPASSRFYPLDVSGTYLRDRKEGRTERVSVSSTGTMLISGGNYTTISNDGRYVLTPLNTLNPYTDDPLDDQSHGRSGHFLFDRQTGQLDHVAILGNPQSAPDYAPAGSHMQVVTIGGNARFVLGSLPHNGVVDSDTNDLQDVFVRDIGIDNLGVGSLAPASNRRITLPARGGFEKTGSATFRDAPDDALIPDLGAEILETRLVYRPELDDLFLRIDVERMFGRGPLTGLTPSPVIYGARITTGSGTFELRAQGYGGLSSSGGVFGLFRCTKQTCAEKVDLSGGFGTVGEAIVTSIPLRHLGLDRGGEITNVEAFAGPGTYDLGVTHVLDAVGR